MRKKDFRISNRLHPAFESLETRACPAVTYNLVGNTLVVVGNNAADTVKLTFNGAGTVSGDFNENGMADDMPFVGVTRFSITTQGGDDRVEFQLTGPLTVPLDLQINESTGNDVTIIDFTANDVNVANVATVGQPRITIQSGDGNDVVIMGLRAIIGADNRLAVQADLGKGGDSFEATLSPSGAVGIADTASVVMNVDGGRGNDTQKVTANNYNVGGDLRVNLTGDRGDDIMNFDYSGALPPVGNTTASVRLRARGGEGDDTAVVNLNPTLRDGGKATVNAVVDGEDGNDSLSLRYTKVGKSGGRTLIDGGAGFDFCKGEGSVDVANCEDEL